MLALGAWVRRQEFVARGKALLQRALTCIPVFTRSHTHTHSERFGLRQCKREEVDDPVSWFKGWRKASHEKMGLQLGLWSVVLFVLLGPWSASM